MKKGLDEQQEFANDLIDFISYSPSTFHATRNIKAALLRKGFKELSLTEEWNIEKEGRYFVSQNDTSLITFVVGMGAPETDGFRIIAAHTDSPCIKIKPAPEITTGGYLKLNTEVYGGAILSSFQSGKTFYTGSQGRLVIRGEIKTEPSPGLDYTTNNLFHVRGDWGGTVVIGPGEGITNYLGRVYVGACLEVTNGVFRLAAGGQKMGGHSLVEILNVTGNGSAFSNTKGHLKLTAGELYSTQGNYSEISNYGHVEVVGGKINTPSSEWLVGLTGPAKVSVSNGGEFVVGNLRLGQFSGGKNEFNLGKGGLIRPKLMKLEYGNDQDVTFNFDGGRFQSDAAPDGNSSLFYAPTHAKWAGVNFCVREGGAVLDSTNGKHVWWSRPLTSGAEQDGGLTCILGSNKDIVLCDAAQCSYNGPTRTVFATGVNVGSLQCRVANALPATTTLQIGPHTQVGFNGSWSSGNDLDQTVARVEGVGQVAYCSKLVVTNGISAVFDGEYGTLTFGNSCSLAGTYDIVGNTNGCGCVKFKQAQDVSNLSLKIANVDVLDSHARSNFYKIVDAPNGITGTFALAADWPRGWAVKYAADGTSVYVYHQNGTQIIVR